MSQEARETKEYPEYCKQTLLNLRESLILQIYVTVKVGDFSRPATTRFSPLLFKFLSTPFLTKYDKTI